MPTARPPRLLSAAALLPAAALLAGCLGPLDLGPRAAAPDATPVGPPRAVPAHADSLLARLTPGALDYVYRPTRGTALARDAWAGWGPLTLTVEDVGPSGAVAGRYRQRLDGGRAAVLEATGTLADTTARDGVATPASPLPAVLPDEPPYLDARVRERYARRRVATTWPNGAAAEAVLRDESGAQAVRRAVVVVDTLTGRVLAAHVERRTRSLLYDETTHASVAVGRLPDGRAVPRRVRLASAVDTPVSPRRALVQVWLAQAWSAAR